MSKWNLGIDVSKATLDVALLADDGHVESASFANDPAGHAQLLRWLKKGAGGRAVHACLEATGTYGFEAAGALHRAGYRVSVVNPARTAAYARSQLRRNKTDKLDAALLADFCLTQNPPLWTPPNPEIAELQALVRRFGRLERLRRAEQCRLTGGVQSTTVAATLLRHIAFLKQEAKALKKEILGHIRRHPNLKHQHELLTSIPGFGDLTAARLLGELPPIENFDSPKQLAAYTGLNPRQRQSGASRGRTSISKVGNAKLRQSLYMPAIVAKQFNPVIRTFCQRLAENDKLPMEQVVAAMRKLLHLAYGVLKNDTPFDPNWERTLEKQALAS